MIFQKQYLTILRLSINSPTFPNQVPKIFQFFTLEVTLHTHTKYYYGYCHYVDVYEKTNSPHG